MPKNEDGEFELILGNRQLLSVFFIVVIMLGVFFTMGYIVGRNATPVTTDVAAAIPATDAAPRAVEPAKPPEPTPAPPTETAPQQPAPVAREPEPEPPPAKAERPERTRTKSEAAKSAVTNRPAAGQTYLQLAATSRHEADIMVDVLRKKSFRAMASEIEEKPGTFRVLVGPVTDATTNKTRADLQGAGFPGNAAIRRTF